LGASWAAAGGHRCPLPSSRWRTYFSITETLGKQEAALACGDERNTATLTLAEHAAARGISMDFLRALGLSDSRY